MRDSPPPECDARRAVRLAQEATARLRALRRLRHMLSKRDSYAALDEWFTDPGQPHREVRLCGLSSPSAQVIFDELLSRAEPAASGGAVWDVRHIVLTGIHQGDVRLPDLGVSVWPTGLVIDWEPGTAWTAEAVTGFIGLLVGLTALQPSGTTLLLVE